MSLMNSKCCEWDGNLLIILVKPAIPATIEVTSFESGSRLFGCKRPHTPSSDQLL